MSNATIYTEQHPYTVAAIKEGACRYCAVKTALCSQCARCAKCTCSPLCVTRSDSAATPLETSEAVEAAPAAPRGGRGRSREA